MIALLLAAALGAAGQELPSCWSFELASAPADQQAFPSIRLGPDETVVLHHGSGSATWRAGGDSIVVASTSGSVAWTLTIRARGVPSAVLRHGVGDPHDPEPAIELAARPVACAGLARDPVESVRADTPPRLVNAEEIDAALRREPDRSGVRRSALVRFRVAPDGSVLERAVEQTSGDPSIDDSALRIAGAARFEPAALGGKPVEAWGALWFHLR